MLANCPLQITETVKMILSSDGANSIRIIYQSNENAQGRCLDVLDADRENIIFACTKEFVCCHLRDVSSPFGQFLLLLHLH